MSMLVVGSNQPQGQCLVEQRHSQNGPDEGRGGEVGTSPSGAEIAQGKDEQRDAHPVAEKVDDTDKDERSDLRQHCPL